MERKFKQLSYEERIKIETLYERGKSLRYIARVLGRSPNTISREFKERKVNGLYIPKGAQYKAYLKRYWSKKDCMKVAQDSYLASFVEGRIKEKWSPERIAGYLSLNGHSLSTKAVYKYIYSRSLDDYLFWNKNKKRSGRKKYRHTLKMSRNFIDKRPVLKGSGHLEADFVVSSQNSYCLLVVVDRWTRYVWILKLSNRKHAVVTRAFQRIIGGLKVKSITLDNDIAFSAWKQLEQTLHTRIYFTHPYHSWEKGLIENTNRWIRVFVPKKRDIKTVSQKELYRIQTFLNTVPRKVLGFRTASELLLEELKCPN
jgi:IS30 family transposase